MAAAGFPDGGRFPPPLLSQGATQEVHNAGNHEQRTKAAGRREGMGFRIYIDTQMTDALDIARLVASSTNSDSGDDSDFPIRTPRADPLRTELRISPVRVRPGRILILDLGQGPWVFDIRRPSYDNTAW